jgi:hypothetical protein
MLYEVHAENTGDGTSVTCGGKDEGGRGRREGSTGERGLLHVQDGDAFKQGGKVDLDG